MCAAGIGLMTPPTTRIYSLSRRCESFTDCLRLLAQIAAGRALTGIVSIDLNEDDFQCYTASLSKYVRRNVGLDSEVAGSWDCVINSDTSYLSAGAERGW